MGQVIEHAGWQTKTNVRGTAGNDDVVRDYLERFAQALTKGDAKTIASMWTTPAIVISDQGIKSLPTRLDVERMFAGAKEQYTARGIKEARPLIRRVEWLTPKIVSVDVRWPYIDSHGREIGSESSVYTFMRNESGDLEMAAIVMRGEERPSAAV